MPKRPSPRGEKPKDAVERERDPDFTGMRWEEHHFNDTFTRNWKGPPPRLNDTINKGFISPRSWATSSTGLWETKGKGYRPSFEDRSFGSVRQGNGSSTADPRQLNLSASRSLEAWHKSPGYMPRRSAGTPVLRQRALQGHVRAAVPAHTQVAQSGPACGHSVAPLRCQVRKEQPVKCPAHMRARNSGCGVRSLWAAQGARSTRAATPGTAPPATLVSRRALRYPS